MFESIFDWSLLGLNLKLQDTGISIKLAFLPYVFDYFGQGDGSITTTTFGGMRLELAIVCHIIEMLGETIKAESLGEVQEATFTVTLPRYADSNFNKSGGGVYARRTGFARYPSACRG
ncbi:hypothetical protein WA1_42595 [Scytonema hofmannii PCC 7110]|uniref:Histidine kinase/HSP90-like ATPase domain-containing protein n=1 Tax=Scytonema hofmannii PCC 7110 TaxID=128403 RepID=A0A139WVD4_9CYAN|nr:ATP-binding protein [Scytonema hofmannii]KYC36400.1 hypothetical protein WA1_42595 [Scytonema hofmannii PCC 7110]